ncbi:MAG: S9 family peptidase, partial [Actinomycetota bacterium]|nr:S9 family peptidase [Actinomycetota bacterium]
MPYREPDADLVAIIDAPPTPAATLSPDDRWLLLVHYESHPPVAALARPVLRLGGIRIDPVRRSRQRTLRLVGLTLVEVTSG